MPVQLLKQKGRERERKGEKVERKKDREMRETNKIENVSEYYKTHCYESFYDKDIN